MHSICINGLKSTKTFMSIAKKAAVDWKAVGRRLRELRGFDMNQAEFARQVAYSSNGKDNVNEMKEGTVIGTDSTELKKAGDDNEVTYYRISETHTGRYGDNDSTIEKTRYVIAKDGMVVTVEGNDETKTKELVKEIENKLG